ncbi:hypothetical protein NM688_g417 [Phlebia brevispora]|uniref:Uncharacterized protein n=1 Tax=Phlebia brevispora TaxID=194682 RepID=A0ACC1TF58_9APHY|nr:hypothetical protein NM688_g417 [Phlebia brevispora]
MSHAQRDVRPTPVDGYPTYTSRQQATTEKDLKARLDSVLSDEDSGSGPLLHRKLHLDFLLRNLRQGFPERYASQDASQPWLIFWTLQGFSVMGVGLDERTKQHTIDTLLAMQHPDGGFAGGPGQFAHLLPTYAAVCALAIVGRPGKGGGWDDIDRENMYEFFMSLKQPDGSFLVSYDAEVDVRGIYCLLVVATMLNILTPELLTGVPEFIASCQTYEGGFGSASFPEWAFAGAQLKDSTAPRPPLGEAHGGYTFCAAASWILLRPLLRWLVQMQAGGSAGALHWSKVYWRLERGGSWHGHGAEETEKARESDHESDWDDVDDSLLNRKALQEYVLYAAQHHAGGLVDKPPKRYHTLYCLSGLSAAQHRVVPTAERKQELLGAWKPVEKESERDQTILDLRKAAFIDTLSWVEEEGTSKYVGGAQNRLNATHPLANLCATHIQGIMAHFYHQTIPHKRAP